MTSIKIFSLEILGAIDKTTVNKGTADQEFTVGNSDGGPALNENVMNLETLERCLI